MGSPGQLPSFAAATGTSSKPPFGARAKVRRQGEEQPIAAENPRLTRPTHTTRIGLVRLNCLSVAVTAFVRPGPLTTEYVNVVAACSSELSRGRTVVGRSGCNLNGRVAVDTAAFVRC